ncbi:MAG: response regulator [Acidobacteria bacterium]|nr:response regulator [Acidobacteriota bacterium]NIM60207.1 response regulator [Acidobacteriota bacterium]NIO60245.1 response regulator [Acidobacteriota bacterium]NIQ31300.1 response regulator [Acidobacteriota bacterium]NIQ86523.1 response regulator [Acidobacteriota bacterium]
MRELASEILSINGYTVVEAGNGVEALDLYEKNPEDFDMLVTDVVMPQMGGKELAERIAALTPEPRVLFLSGYTSTAIIQQGLLEVDTNFLQKPFTPADLAGMVRKLLDS